MEPRDDGYRQRYDAYDLGAGERRLGSWQAARGGWQFGGMLVLTNQRLLFEPIRTPAKLLTGPLASLVGLGPVGQAIDIGLASVQSAKPLSIPLSEVATVQAVPGTSSLHVTRRSGEVWDFSISASKWAFRWDPANARARDGVVEAVGNAAASVTPAAPVLQPPSDSPVAHPFDPFESDPEMRALRQQAMTTGRIVVVPESANDPEGFVYFAPDGSAHGAMRGFFDPIPADAVLPSNLVGTWVLGGSMASTWPGEPASVGLLADGHMTGRIQAFGALPPIPAYDGKWWWQAALFTLTLSYRMTPFEIPMTIETRSRIPVTSITDMQIVGSWEEGPVTLTRVPI